MKLKIATGLIVMLLALTATLICSNVQANPSLSLDFYKNNGYGSGADMNGEWTINTVISQDIQRVEFYLDNQLMLNDTAVPFSWNFNTGSYSDGQHTIKAVAYNAQGETATAVSERNFTEFPMMQVIGIIGIVVVVVGLSFGFALFRAHKKEKEHQKKNQA
jgi:hypothetical protein